MPWLHAPEPLGAGGCTLACTPLGRAHSLVGRVLRAQVRAIAAHSSPRCPLRSAARSAGAVAMRVRRGTRWSEDARAQPRPGSAGTGAGAVGTAPAYPAILCGPRHGMPTAPAYGTGAAHGLPSSVPVFSDRCNCNKKSVMPAYTAPLFRSSPRPVSRRPSGGPSCRSLAAVRDRRDARPAVRRRPRSDRYRPAHLGRPLPPASPASPAEPVRRRPRRRRHRRRRSWPVAVPRLLPGFSGFSQGSPPLYLRVCECRHSN